MSDSSDYEKLGGITSPCGPAARGRTQPGGNSKGTCTKRSVSTSHLSPVNRPFAPWTRRHHRPATGHWPPVTGQIGITHDRSSQSNTSHWPSSHRSLNLENINTGESQYSPAIGHRSTSHQLQVIRLYTNLRLAILMPWAWSSLIIEQIWVLNSHSDMQFRTQLITQKECYYPWNRTLVICPIPVLS